MQHQMLQWMLHSLRFSWHNIKGATMYICQLTRFDAASDAAVDAAMDAAVNAAIDMAITMY